MNEKQKVDELYKELKKLRISQNKSQTNISEYMGFKLSSSLSHVEAGNKNISINKLLKWLEALNIDLDVIIQDSKNGVDFNLLHQALNNSSSKEINDLLKQIKNKY